MPPKESKNPWKQLVDQKKEEKRQEQSWISVEKIMEISGTTRAEAVNLARRVPRAYSKEGTFNEAAVRQLLMRRLNTF